MSHLLPKGHYHFLPSSNSVVFGKISSGGLCSLKIYFIYSQKYVLYKYLFYLFLYQKPLYLVCIAPNKLENPALMPHTFKLEKFISKVNLI